MAADRPGELDGWSRRGRRRDAEARDLDLAWRLCRGVVSNAIVLVKDGMVIGLGSGQTSRVDAARQAVAKAGPERTRGAACGSDAFYPFPDAVQVCLDAGVTAFAQPGGSMHDAEVIAAAEKAGAVMLIRASATSATESDCTAQEVDDDRTAHAARSGPRD